MPVQSNSPAMDSDAYSVMTEATASERRCEGASEEHARLEPSFAELITELPGLLAELQHGPLHTRFTVPRRTPGLYVFYEGDAPLYVGRSNDIRNRVQNHGRPSSGHNSATFAYLLAQEEAARQGLTKQGTRGDWEQDPAFAMLYARAKERVWQMRVRVVEVAEPLLQTVLEVYAHLSLATPYNDFDNH